MNTTNLNDPENDPAAQPSSRKEGGYGSPAPEQEVQDGADSVEAPDTDSSQNEEAAEAAEVPSSEAPLTEENTSASEQGPFSSESSADASGEPI